MFLIYVFKDGSWEFWESVRWINFFEVIYGIEVDISRYLDLEYVDNEPDHNQWRINYDRFLYDMIHYKQYVSDKVVIYYLDGPGAMNG